MLGAQDHEASGSAGAGSEHATGSAGGAGDLTKDGSGADPESSAESSDRPANSEVIVQARPGALVAQRPCVTSCCIVCGIHQAVRTNSFDCMWYVYAVCIQQLMCLK